MPIALFAPGVIPQEVEFRSFRGSDDHEGAGSEPAPSTFPGPNFRVGDDRRPQG